MTFLDSFVATPLAEALGWALVHSLWQGAIIATAVAAVRLVAPSAVIRYTAACAGLLLAAVGFGITFLRLTPAGVHFQPLQALARPVSEALAVVESASSLHPDLIAIIPWLAPLWIVGLSVVYIRQAAGLVLVYRLRRRGVCQAPRNWQQELTRLGARMKLSRPVRLTESCLAETPVVVGCTSTINNGISKIIAKLMASDFSARPGPEVVVTPSEPV